MPPREAKGLCTARERRQDTVLSLSAERYGLADRSQTNARPCLS